MTAISIIGAGKLGTSLGRILSKKGYKILWISDKDPAAARESRRMIGRGKATTDVARAAEHASVIFLCVPDEEIARVAKRLAGARFEWKEKIVFHTSGIFSSKALMALKAKGASIGSFHPAQSFSRKDTPPRHFKKITIGLDGDARALDLARKIIKKIGASPVIVKPENKRLYHAACSLASNLFIPLLDMACELLEQAGIKKNKALKILLPLVEGTLQNVKHFDRAAALTGPIARGDSATVYAHLGALKKFPRARRAYRILGAKALDLARKKNVPPKKIKNLSRMLEGK